jgi:dTDP-4-dehydrorhamnose 3,5-epimerase
MTMRFAETTLAGVITVTLDAAGDERGFFARTFCDDEFLKAGIAMQPRQINLSNNTKAFTLRGLHYQAAPNGESKVVQCVRGRIFDVVVDLRGDSPTFRHWLGIELAPDLRRMVFIPEGCAHGFLTLEDASDVYYLMGSAYLPEAGRGVRWNDPAFGIVWPAPPRVISARDDSYPDYGL